MLLLRRPSSSSEVDPGCRGGSIPSGDRGPFHPSCQRWPGSGMEQGALMSSMQLPEGRQAPDSITICGVRLEWDRVEIIRERLLERSIPIPHCGCWIWLGSDTGNGYGKINLGEEIGYRVVHRIAYEVFRGPIPAGLLLDHLCRVRSCLNPYHLEPVTPRENTLRGNAVLFKTGAEYDH